MSRASELLNENSETTFTSKISDVSIDFDDSLKELFKDITSQEGYEFSSLDVDSDVTVKWGYEVEAREYGIKHFSIFVPDQKISVPVSLRYSLPDDEDLEETRDWEYTGTLDVEMSGTLENGFSLYPTELDLVNNLLIF